MKTLTIGIAGTAKNTGKTTTTMAIMAKIKEQPKIKLGLTSIGYDGEDLDNVTGLPKPKIEVWPEVLVAVAEKCLDVSSAVIEVLEQTNISTPLGKIIVGKVKKKGRLVIAGPNKSKELRLVLERLHHHRSNFNIVDGALNRIAPLVEVDALILATGAARKQKIMDLAFETHCLVEVLQIRTLIPMGITISTGSILARGSVEELLMEFKNKESIYIEGVIGEKSLDYLLGHNDMIKGKSLILPDAIKLIVAGDINHIHNLLEKAKKIPLKIGVKKPLHVIALTINPYYPQYRFKSENYEAAYVDRQELYEAISENLSVPVYDVVWQGGDGLFQEILDFWNNHINR